MAPAWRRSVRGRVLDVFPASPGSVQRGHHHEFLDPPHLHAICCKAAEDQRARVRAWAHVVLRQSLVSSVRREEKEAVKDKVLHNAQATYEAMYAIFCVAFAFGAGKYQALATSTTEAERISTVKLVSRGKTTQTETAQFLASEQYSNSLFVFSQWYRPEQRIFPPLPCVQSWTRCIPSTLI